MTALPDHIYLKCLRCNDATLNLLPSPLSIRFFECPECKRHYSLKENGLLTFRWPHPIGVALYGIQFKSAPLEHIDNTVEELLISFSQEQMPTFIKEMKLELEHPTQHIRDIVDCVASEELCREFLSEVVTRLEKQAI